MPKLTEEVLTQLQDQHGSEEICSCVIIGENITVSDLTREISRLRVVAEAARASVNGTHDNLDCRLCIPVKVALAALDGKE